MGPLVFNFEDLASDTAHHAIERYFRGAGAHMVHSVRDPAIRRADGVSSRRIAMTFSDGQKLAIAIRQDGNIHGAELNGKDVSLKATDDQEAAMAELARLMDRGREKYQEALARARVSLPPAVSTSTAQLEAALKDRAASLDEAIGLLNEELGAI